MERDDPLEERLRELRTSLEALPEVVEPPKSTLRILGSLRSEQVWNTLLAYFLDPSQPHGFGADLLKGFLDKSGVEYYHRDLEAVRVDTESTSPNDNRLDVVIRAPDAWFVCIESKVEASEGTRQTERYVEDTHVGSFEKSEFPEGGHHYVFLSKAYSVDASADAFSDLYWTDVVDIFTDVLGRSHGRYPERSVNQIEDFVSTIRTVTRMEETDFTKTQKEKVRLLGEYRDDFDELLDAAESLRNRSIEEWPERFRAQLSDAVWTDEWHTRPDYGKYGCIFRQEWYRDDEELAPTLDHEATWGDTGFRLHFTHMIRRKRSFARGELTYILRCPTSVPLRDEFHRLYNSETRQERLTPLLAERGITNKGNKKDITRKTYDVDQSGLPETYFETLATAFEEHLPVASVADEILDEALENVERD